MKKKQIFLAIAGAVVVLAAMVFGVKTALDARNNNAVLLKRPTRQQPPRQRPHRNRLLQLFSHSQGTSISTAACQ